MNTYDTILPLSDLTFLPMCHFLRSKSLPLNMLMLVRKVLKRCCIPEEIQN